MTDIDEKIVFFTPCTNTNLIHKEDIQTCFVDIEPYTKNKKDINNLGVTVIIPSRATLDEILFVLENMKQRTCCPAQEFVYRFFEAKGAYMRLPQIYNTRRFINCKKEKKEHYERCTKLFHFVERDKLLFLKEDKTIFSQEWNDSSVECDQVINSKRYKRYKETIKKIRDSFLFGDREQRIF
eukprot:GHVR01179769.1.p1 GENE.GHVR01179769.1~~GHVR01179769.1.p1  ORF type:complete len:182 (+),score=27.85 GHVR01179769.1:2398-2943(+)